MDKNNGQENREQKKYPLDTHFTQNTESEELKEARAEANSYRIAFLISSALLSIYVLYLAIMGGMTERYELYTWREINPAVVCIICVSWAVEGIYNYVKLKDKLKLVSGLFFSVLGALMLSVVIAKFF